MCKVHKVRKALRGPLESVRRVKQDRLDTPECQELTVRKVPQDLKELKEPLGLEHKDQLVFKVPTGLRALKDLKVLTELKDLKVSRETESKDRSVRKVRAVHKDNKV